MRLPGAMMPITFSLRLMNSLLRLPSIITYNDVGFSVLRRYASASCMVWFCTAIMVYFVWFDIFPFLGIVAGSDYGFSDASRCIRLCHPQVFHVEIRSPAGRFQCGMHFKPQWIAWMHQFCIWKPYRIGRHDSIISIKKV